MRTRTRLPQTTEMKYGYIGKSTDTWYNYTFTSDRSGKVDVPCRTETIIDSPSPIRAEKACSHVITQTGPVANEPKYVNLGWADPYQRSTDSVLLYGDPIVTSPSPPSDLSERSFDNMAYELEDKLTNAYSFRTSVINDFFELKDVKSTLLSFRALLNARTFAGSAKELANSHLAYKFGVLPTIGMVNKLINLRRNIEKKIKFLSKNAGKVIPLHVRSTASHSETVESNYNIYSTRTEWKSTQVVSCKAKLKETVRNMSYLDHLTSYLGMNKPLQIIWEGIPFSFIVDWFVSIQDVVMHVENDLKEAIFETPQQMTCSSKRETSVTYGFKWPMYSQVYCGTHWRTLPSDVICFDNWRNSRSEYSRVVLPFTVGWSGIEAKLDLSPHKLLTSLELVLQRS